MNKNELIHHQGLKNLESKIQDGDTDIDIEIIYNKSEVDLRAIKDRTLSVYEHKTTGHEKYALKQLRTHQKYFVPQFIKDNPQYEINNVKYYYSNPNIVKLKFEHKI